MGDTSWKDELKTKIKEHIEGAVDASNTAVASNVGKKGSRTSVSSRQRVVQRDGRTTTVTERTETQDG